MRRRFQKKLFLFIFAAFVFTIGLCYTQLTIGFNRRAENFVRMSVEHVAQQVVAVQENKGILNEWLKTVLLEKAKGFAVAVSLMPDSFLKDPEILQEWVKSSGLSEASIVDADGIVQVSTVKEQVGFDFKKYKETKKYLRLAPLQDGTLVEDVRRTIWNDEEHELVQFVGVSRKDADGFIQAGHSFERYLTTMDIATIKDEIKHFKMGLSGYLLMIKDDLIIASSKPELVGKKIDDIGLPLSAGFPQNGVFFSLDGSLFCIYMPVVDGSGLIGVYPKKEMYAPRRTVLIENFFLFFILYAVMFAVVSVLLNKEVISGIDKINAVLAKISKGNLQEQVNVRTNPEFISLSNGINKMVAALRKAFAEASERIERELSFARQIQQFSVPSTFPPYPQKNEFDIFASMIPAKEICGDFYDFFLLEAEESKLVVIIADVAGKGIPAGLFMMSAKTLIKNLAEEGFSSAEILTRANKKLCVDNKTSMFVTVFLGILDLKTGRFVFANAGHNSPLLKRSGEPSRLLRCKSGVILGAVEGTVYEQQEIVLNGGDLLFMYTDGVTEAQNGQGELFGEERLMTVIDKEKSTVPDALLPAVRSKVDAFVNGAEAFDDMTMLGLQYNGYAIEVNAVFEEQEAVQDFVFDLMHRYKVPDEVEAEIGIVLDEICSNIVRYAYEGKRDEKMSIRVFFGGKPFAVTLIFIDSGTPFNPLEREDPDLSEDIENRGIGKLGIYMVKHLMTSVEYEYKDGKNILTLRKTIENLSENE